MTSSESPQAEAPQVEAPGIAAPATPPCFPLAGGGVTSARGFSAAGVRAGFRKEPDRLDLALVASDEPCAFTTGLRSPSRSVPPVSR